MRRPVLALLTGAVSAAALVVPLGAAPAQAVECANPTPGGHGYVTLKPSASKVTVGSRWTLTSVAYAKPKKVVFQIESGSKVTAIYTVINPAGKRTTINMTAPSAPGKTCYSAHVVMPDGRADTSPNVLVTFVR